MSAAVQHDAVRVLRLQGRLQLRQSQRKMVPDVYDRVANDGGVRCRRQDDAVHQPLHLLRSPGKRDRRSHPRRADVSALLAWSLELLQVRHGQSVS